MLEDEARRRARRHDVHDLRHGPAREQGRQLIWNTANVTWVVDARPDSVDYLGRKADKITVVLAQATTDASGAFTRRSKAPQDFGGIHDIYAVVDGVQVAKGGFLIARSATMSPKRGPIGTMITVTYSGLGSSLYEGGASLLYDNKYVGAIMANWTRGVAVGAHPRRAARSAGTRSRSPTRSASTT